MSLVVTGDTGSSTSLSAAVPSNAAAGTVMVALLHTFSTDAASVFTSGAPAGWNFGAEITASNQGVRGRYLYYWKRCTAADSGTYTWTVTTSATWTVVIAGMTNLVTVGTPWNVPPTGTNGLISDATTLAANGVTPLGATSTIIAFGANAGGGSWTPPSGWTERYDAGTRQTLIQMDSPVAGTPTGSITFTCSGSGYMRALALALATDDHVATRDAAFNLFTATTARTVTLPAHEPGDRITIVVSGKSESTTVPTISSGWTLVKSGTGGTGSLAADTGQMFVAVYMRDVVAGESTLGGTPITNPTVTPGATAPDTWNAIASVATPSTGKSMRDAIASNADYVQLISDTDTATSGTGGTASAMTGQPRGGDAIHVFSCHPADALTTWTAAAASASGLTNGSVAATTVVNSSTVQTAQGTSVFNRNSLGTDSSMGFFDWVDFDGTATSGITASVTTNSSNQSGIVVVVAHRQTTGGTTINGGQATSTSTAQAGSVVSGSVVSGGMATSTSTALAGALLLGYLVAGGQATETDTAQAGAVATGEVIVGGQSSETDTAPAGTTLGGALVAGGQASETDSALAGQVHQARTGGTAAETDTATAGSVLYVITGGQATETDTAQTGSILGGGVTINGGQSSETDTAIGGTVTTGYLDTDTENAVYAVTFDGDADVTWEPAVVARPTLLANGGAQIVARAFTDVDVTDDGFAQYVGMAEETKVRHRNRILIGNEDWTFKYGHPMQVPDFELLDPFMYGDGGTLVFPQINARYEKLGIGRLKRVKLGAPVRYQRVDDDPDSPTYNQVIKTDYKGLILRQGRRGDSLQLAVGGELLGRAAMKWHPVPIFRKIRDAAVQIGNAVVGMGLRYAGRFDDLGINLASRGGMYEDQYLLDTIAQLVTGDGDQWTVMPQADGAYTHTLKDVETIHATVILDNDLASPDLGEDLAEKYNRVWINAVSPDGQRIMHATAPRLVATALPERPTVSGGPMVIGTENADTSTGDGVTVLVWRLAFCGLLDLDDVPGGFDDDVADAVREFQKTAGCANLTGSVDAETWEKLWDNSVTDYSIAFAAQRPAVETDEVQKFDRAGSGSIIGLHDGYDPKVPLVDLPLDMGLVPNRRRAFRMARHKLHLVDQADWVGQITLTSGLIDGEWNPGDPFDESMVIENRDVRPGWNIWEPFFDGGTLFPVVACQIGDNGRTVTLLVDTRARPAMEAWQVWQRNRDNRYQPSRYLGGHRRRSVAVQDTVTPWDKIVGQTDRDWDLQPGWNHIPVPAGQVGTVSQTHIRLDAPHEFAALVSETQLPLARLTDKITPLEAPPSDPQRHVIAVTGRPTGGTYTLQNDAADETTAIAHDAGPTAVQAAIRTLGGSFAGVTVSGEAGGPYTVSMHGATADLDVADNSLTGGSSPSISVDTYDATSGPGTPWWGQDSIRRWLKRYGVPIAWGTFEKPCGYGNYQKTNPDGTPSAAPLTGEHFDGQSFGYDCGVFGAILHLYIWVGQENLLPRQRIFRQQLDGSGT